MRKEVEPTSSYGNLGSLSFQSQDIIFRNMRDNSYVNTRQVNAHVSG